MARTGPRRPARLRLRRCVRHRAVGGQSGGTNRARRSRDRVRTRLSRRSVQLEALDRRTSFPRTAVGAADHRLLRRRAAVGRPRRLSATENEPGRESRHRPRSARCRRAARADPASGAAGHQSTPPRPPPSTPPSTSARTPPRTAGPSAVAELRGKDGRRHRLEVSTRIGRRPDNDIVLDDDDVSRYHAVIIDTGSSFVISDLRSTNGVQVQGRRIRPAPPFPMVITSASAATNSPSKSARAERAQQTQEFGKNPQSPARRRLHACGVGERNRPQRRITSGPGTQLPGKESQP